MRSALKAWSLHSVRGEVGAEHRRHGGQRVDPEQVKRMRQTLRGGGTKAVEKQFGKEALQSAEFREAQRLEAAHEAALASRRASERSQSRSMSF